MIEDYKHKLLDNKLMRIENRLRKVEIILLKNFKSEKSIKKEIKNLEKEEELIEEEQKKLEKKEEEILREIKKVEKEEKWSNEVMYSCSSKDMEGDKIRCTKTGKLCSLDNCPLVK